MKKKHKTKINKSTQNDTPQEKEKVKDRKR